MMQGLTGKKQTPSEAWGFNQQGLPWYNPKNVADFAMDALLDPTNIAGVGLVDDALKLGVRKGARKAIAPEGWAPDFSSLTNTQAYRNISELATHTANTAAETLIPGRRARNTQRRVQDMLANRDRELAIGDANVLEQIAPVLANRSRALGRNEIGALYRAGRSFEADSYMNELTGLELDDIRSAYHNAARFLQPEEIQLLRKHGTGNRTNYQNYSNLLPDNSTHDQIDNWWAIRNANNDLLAGISSETRSSPSLQPKPAVKNKSGFTKEELLAAKKPSGKKDVSDLSDDEFAKTLLKPTGELVDEFTGSLEQAFSGKNSVNALSPAEYVKRFNKNLPELNKLIAKNNKTGVEYKVKGLKENGSLEFYSPGNGGVLSKGTMPAGSTEWGVRIKPGEWRGEVQDIPSREYFRSIPGLEMSNTTAGVFPDRIPRKGSGAYESLNEYLKKFNLGRVKPGFNSQTEHSRGAWEKFVNSDRAAGFYGNPSTVYGSMKNVALPAAGVTGAAAAQERAYGGSAIPDYIAEGGEVVDFNQGNVPQAGNFGKLSRLSSNMTKINGDSHDAPSGGVEMAGGERVYTDRIIVPQGFTSKLRKL
jgi:hypothetical protein